MNSPEANIRVKVDPANPGQFFACCGLLELADRLWPGAEGWFEKGMFYIKCPGTLKQLLDAFLNAEVKSTLSDEELKRLGTLLSAKKADLSPEEIEEKENLHERWKKYERLYLAKPFDLWVDWWRDEKGERTELKTWAAKQFVLEILRPLIQALRGIIMEEVLDDILQCPANVDGLPFYFDSEAYSQNTDIDIGFSPYKLRHIISTRDIIKPALEVFAFFGLQRFRPRSIPGKEVFRYTLWPIPLPPVIAAAVVCKAITLPDTRSYEFRPLKRTKYMKAFRSAILCRGD